MKVDEDPFFKVGMNVARANIQPTRTRPLGEGRLTQPWDPARPRKRVQFLEDPQQQTRSGYGHDQDPEKEMAKKETG